MIIAKISLRDTQIFSGKRVYERVERIRAAGGGEGTRGN